MYMKAALIPLSALVIDFKNCVRSQFVLGIFNLENA